jgi:hypothetical protein
MGVGFGKADYLADMVTSGMLHLLEGYSVINFLAEDFRLTDILT